MTNHDCYELAHRHFALYKEAGNADLTYALAGDLYLSNSGWGLLHVPNALARGAFDALREVGIELPPNSTGRFNAHISVLRPEEIEQVGGPQKFSEWGHTFHYTLGPVRTAHPAGWDEMSKVWFIEIKSPELEKLRKAYGLPPHPKFPFHCTIAVRRKHVLNENEVSKVALDQIAGGKADKKPDSTFKKTELRAGQRHEAEHTDDPALAKEIATDHLAEDPEYYSHLDQFEAQHAKTAELDNASTTVAEEETEKKAPVVAVDLDGTLAEYDEWKGEDHFGALRRGAKKALENFRNSGYTIIINTCRGDVAKIRKWLEDNDLPFDHINENPDQPDGVNPAKIFADVYIDDKAINAKEKDWRKIEKETHNILKDASSLCDVADYLATLYPEFVL